MPHPATTTKDLTRPGWLTSRAWPFPVTTIDVDQHRLGVTDVGSGPTLLFIHVGMSSLVWRDALLALTPQWRCVTLDAPGSGVTQGHTRVDLDRASAAIDRVVRDLDLRDFVLVVHDLGGPAALDAAASWPERVRGVAAVNSFGWRPSGAAFRLMLSLMGSTVVRELDVATGWLPRLTSTRFGVGRQWESDLRKTFRKSMHRHGRRAFHRYMRSARRHDFTRVDEAVQLLADRPLLTVFGERNDPLSFQPRWAELFADHVQVEIAGGNHFPMCDDPAGLAGAIHNRFSDRPLVGEADKDAHGGLVADDAGRVSATGDVLQ